jgi:DNA-directed RNA polymerase specialized sigma24 family protein
VVKPTKQRSLTVLRLWHERNAADGRADEKYALITVAKTDGATYQEIADVLGVTRQAVSKFMQERETR